MLISFKEVEELDFASETAPSMRPKGNSTGVAEEEDAKEENSSIMSRARHSWWLRLRLDT